MNIGSPRRFNYTAMGDVVNTASRLQTAAQPGQVLVGPAAVAATHQVVQYRSLGPLVVKGREELFSPHDPNAPTEPAA